MRIGIDKTKVPADEAADSARDLAELLDIDAAAYAKAVKAAGRKAFVEALVLRNDDARSCRRPRWRRSPARSGIAEERPLAPTRDFASEILGRVGPRDSGDCREASGAG